MLWVRVHGRRGSRGGHLHTGLGDIALLDGLGAVLLADADLVVLLDDGAAGAPVRRAAVVKPAALDVVALTDLAALEHRITIP